MGLLYWCIHNALRPENAAKLERLKDAPPSLLVSLLGLSLLSLLLNGAKFWVVISPVHRLKFWDVQAVNGIAAVASYAPAKLSIVARALIHQRRDGVPLLTAGAWMVAVGLLLLGALVPLIAVSLWRKQIDMLFVVVGTIGLVVNWALIVSIARAFAGQAGLERVRRVTARLSLLGNRVESLTRRFTHSQVFGKLFACFDMLADARTVAAALAIRVLDLLVQAARFLVAAQIVGVTLTIDTAVIAACTFYLIGVLSPSGALGARESGTTGLASFLTIPGVTGGGFAPISLIVSGTEIIINITAAFIGLLWLKPWRLLRRAPT